jgi:Asp-tRNA(Asn)/Glu-tRNA(Gln) amidotransferase A subunit family amidase
VTPQAERAARAVVRAARDRLGTLLGDRVLVVPSAAGPAPDASADPSTVERTRTATLALTCLAGTLGAPALSVPALLVPGGPVGLCLIGPCGSDESLLDLALAAFPTDLAAATGRGPASTEGRP